MNSNQNIQNKIENQKQIIKCSSINKLKLEENNDNNQIQNNNGKISIQGQKNQSKQEFKRQSNKQGIKNRKSNCSIKSQQQQQKINDQDKIKHNQQQKQQKQSFSLKQKEKCQIQKSQKEEIIKQQYSDIQNQQKKKQNLQSLIFQAKQTDRTTNTQAIQQKQLIMVFLMYKQQKLSIILNKSTPFQQLINLMYQQIYRYQKQTFCLSNYILKNVLYKITGYQTYDNDILYDYLLKYKHGKLNKQKFFTVFRQNQQGNKTPFKIYTLIQRNIFDNGYDYLIRNYSDGEYGLMTSVKTKMYSEEKLNRIRKNLRGYFHIYSLMIKSQCSFMGNFNWLQTKHHIFMLSEYYPQSLVQYIKRVIHLSNNNINNNTLYSTIQSIILSIKKIFQSIIHLNIHIFKNISLKNFILSSNNGEIKINFIDQLSHLFENGSKRNSSIQSMSNLENLIKMKINDNFYKKTFSKILEEINEFLYVKNHEKSNQQMKKCKQLIKKLIESIKSNKNDFNFDQIIKMQQFSQSDSIISQLPHIDYKSNISKIAKNIKKNINPDGNLSHRSNNQRYQIRSSPSQISQQIHRFIVTEQRQKQHYDPRNIVNFLLKSLNSTIPNENMGNLQQFLKQQQRKLKIKTKQKLFINEIIDDSNHKQNFVSIIKKNNIKSVQFYLKKSNSSIKKQMIGKIESKYRRLFKNTQEYEQNSNNNSINQKYFKKQLIQSKIIANQSKQINIRQKKSSISKTSQQKSYLKKSKIKIFQSKHEQSNKTSRQIQNSLIQPKQQDKQNRPIIYKTQSSSIFKQTTIYKKRLMYTSCSVMNKQKQRFPSILMSNVKNETVYIHKDQRSKKQKKCLLKKQYKVYLKDGEKNQKNFNSLIKK